MYKFLETYSLPKLSQEETNNSNRPIGKSEIESVIIIKKKPPCKQKSRTDGFTGEFYQTYKEELIQSFSNSSKRLKRKEHCKSRSMKPPSPSYQNQTKTPSKKKITGQWL